MGGGRGKIQLYSSWGFLVIIIWTKLFLFWLVAVGFVCIPKVSRCGWNSSLASACLRVIWGEKMAAGRAVPFTPSLSFFYLSFSLPLFHFPSLPFWHSFFFYIHNAFEFTSLLTSCKPCTAPSSFFFSIASFPPAVFLSHSLPGLVPACYTWCKVAGGGVGAT